MVVVVLLSPYTTICLLSLLALYIRIYVNVYRRQRKRLHVVIFHLFPRGGQSDVFLERGRGMTSILLLFIKMELVYRNAAFQTDSNRY